MKACPKKWCKGVKDVQCCFWLLVGSRFVACFKKCDMSLNLCFVFFKLNSDCGWLHIQGWISEQADLKGRQEKQGCGQYLGGTHTRPFRAWPSTKLWRGAPRMLMCGNAETTLVALFRWTNDAEVRPSWNLCSCKCKNEAAAEWAHLKAS